MSKNTIYSNHLLISNKKKRKKSPFNKKTRRHNPFLTPSSTKSSSHDDLLWEYDARKRKVEFNFGTMNDPKRRSKSQEGDYMRLSSIHNSMSPKSQTRRSSFTSDQKSEVSKPIYGSVSIDSSLTDRDSWIEYTTVAANNSPNYSSRPLQSATDFGYWKHKQRAPKIDSYVLNAKENPRTLQLPDLYSYNYNHGTERPGEFRSKYSSPRRRWNAEHVTQQSISSNDYDDNNNNYRRQQQQQQQQQSNSYRYATEYKYPISSRQYYQQQQQQIQMHSQYNDSNSDSSEQSASIDINEYNRMLPVGKFARQKFRVNREEEELPINHPTVQELLATASGPNEMCDLETVGEYVDMDISDLRNAKVTIWIELDTVRRQKSMPRKWVHKIVRIERVISVDVFSTGHMREFQRVVSEALIANREGSRRSSGVGRNINVSDGNFRLNGSQAVRVFNLLMEIAENRYVGRESRRSVRTKQQFAPRYLMASALNDSSTDLYF